MSGKPGMVATPEHFRVEDRHCQQCGELMRRRVRQSGQSEAWVMYRARKYCSASCAAKATNRAKGKLVAASKPVVGTRKLVAKTCNDCGALRFGSSFCRYANGQHSPTCNACRSARRRAAHRERLREKQYVLDRAKNDATLGGRSHGNEWTGPELELVARRDLTAQQIAEMLGRSRFAVKQARVRIKKDPRFARLAGVA